MNKQEIIQTQETDTYEDSNGTLRHAMVRQRERCHQGDSRQRAAKIGNLAGVHRVICGVFASYIIS